jgi:hypothetical protein
LNGTFAVATDDEPEDVLLVLLLPHAARTTASEPTMRDVYDQRLMLMLSSAVCARTADAVGVGGSPRLI